MLTPGVLLKFLLEMAALASVRVVQGLLMRVEFDGIKWLICSSISDEGNQCITYNWSDNNNH